MRRNLLLAYQADRQYLKFRWLIVLFAGIYASQPIVNKADQVDRQKLMRVYGALMWSLGKVVKTPEVLRVYIGSFWDQELVFKDNALLFEMEERDLMRDLRDLPRNRGVCVSVWGVRVALYLLGQ